MNENPYTAPSSNLLDHGVDPESVSIRKAHIKHEASVKSVGILYYLSGGLMLLAAPSMLFLGDELSAELGGLSNLSTILIVVYAVFGAASLIVGRGLRTLRSWVKIPVGILSGLGLLSVPIGTIINGYILYLVFSKKGTTVFSEEYQLIIENTPEIQYKTPKWVWALVIILLAFIALGIFGIVASDGL